MVPNFPRDASAVFANGFGLPLARLRRSVEDGRPGLLPSGGVPIRLTPRTPTRRPGSDPSFGRIGALEVRLAVTASEVRRAQRLRYRVFYEEGAAIPSGFAMLKRRDIDAYDAVCDHLIVVDHASTEAKPFRAPRPRIVGTYRLLRGERADAHLGFYSACEYDLAPLLARHPGKRILELGRSCVLAPYRTKRTIELLWQGIWAYVRAHRIDAMLGCASLEGTDPDRLALPLSFLHHHARAAEPWRARALPDRYVAMDRLAPEAVDPRAALAALPPLVKGYLRVGARFGDGAVIDRPFGTTDVLVVLPVTAIAARYIGRFDAGADRRAA